MGVAGAVDLGELVEIAGGGDGAVVEADGDEVFFERGLGELAELDVPGVGAGWGIADGDVASG